MKHVKGVQRVVHVGLVMIMLVFASGASRHVAREMPIAVTSTVPSAVPSAVKAIPLVAKAQPSGALSALITTLSDTDALRAKMLQWSLDKQGLGDYSPGQVQRAEAIEANTPLTREDALHLVYYCDLYAIEPALVLAMIDVESKFDTHAVGSSQDRGLMQIIPSTEKWLAKRYGAELGLQYNPKRIFEAEYNLGLSIRYIAHLRDRYGDNTHRVLSEYNRGDKKLAQYFKAYKTYQTTYSKAILKRVDQYAFQDRR